MTIAASYFELMCAAKTAGSSDPAVPAECTESYAGSQGTFEDSGGSLCGSGRRVWISGVFLFQGEARKREKQRFTDLHLINRQKKQLRTVKYIADYRERKRNRYEIIGNSGAGYIGSHTCVELLKEGYEVVIVDNLSNSSKKAVKRVEEITGKPVTFYETDILDKDALVINF